MEQHFNKFEEKLTVACGNMAAEYFQLPVADADVIYRERVYCYELYHQLRSEWHDFPFSLGGEVDKGGHPHFKDGPYAKAKPDFLVHVPGNMEANLACVEVKPFGRPVDEFRGDLRKLTWFCENAAYYRGLFLVYGSAENRGAGALKDQIQAAAANVEDIDLDLIHIYWHPKALSVCEHIVM